MSTDWSFDELQEWDDKIVSIAKKYGLEWFPIVYEMCDYYEMIGSMAYHGMPSHYHYWSYGKSFERTHQMYNLGATGLPYELIINSNPSIAYLMRQNSMDLQILIMAHCIGHSDFFKNNIHFSHTEPDSIIARMRSAKRRVQNYIEDPSIGIENVERVLDSAHAIEFNTERFGRQRIPHKIQQQRALESFRKGNHTEVDVNKVPLKPDNDILGFIIEHGKHLADWERDLVNIVRDESIYFMPQIRTKIMNEGWASFWHYKILNELDLPSKYHIPFLKNHNQVVRPFATQINPYHVGFYIFQRLEKEKGLEACFKARELHHDASAILEFIDEKACHDLGLFSFSRKKSKNEILYTIDSVPDASGWKEIRKDMVGNTGLNRFPVICVENLEKNGDLTLRHEHDGRDLELSYADHVVKHISNLWEGAVKLFTIVEDDVWEI